MQQQSLKEALRESRRALDSATSENIIESCQRHLIVLAEYLSELYKLRGTPAINLYQDTSLSREQVDGVRRDIRSAVADSKQEYNKIFSLLKSFTTISSYEAVSTFNILHYKGLSDWQLAANEVKSGIAENNKMSFQQAVAQASLLRREEYISYRTKAAKNSRIF